MITLPNSHWNIDSATPTLMHTGSPYGIPRDAFRTLVDLRFWADHIAGKGWGTGEVIADLVAAWMDLNVESA